MAKLSEKFGSSLRKKDMKRKQRMSFGRQYDKKIRDTMHEYNNGCDDIHEEVCTFNSELDARAEATRELMNGVYRGNIEKVKRALKNGASIRQTSLKGYSPIEIAHKQKFWEIKKLLGKELAR